MTINAVPLIGAAQWMLLGGGAVELVEVEEELADEEVVLEERRVVFREGRWMAYRSAVLLFEERSPMREKEV